MSNKTYINKTTVIKVTKPPKKPKGGGPNRNPCSKSGMGPRKLRS